MTSLEEALGQFDGKETAVLLEIRVAFGDGAAFRDDLVRLAGQGQAPIASGATWLIKALLDDGVRLTPSQTEALVGDLDALRSWQAQLHVCQSVGRLELSVLQAGTCADWAASLVHSDRPFLRAWAMDALQHLASRSPHARSLAEAALAAAEQDPAASVRARARKWRKPAKGR